MKNNPFFENFDTPFETIPFSKIKTEHFIPAIDKAIEIGKENIEAIVNNQESAGFDNTIEQFEIASELLGMISGVYWHLFGSHGSPNLKKLADEISLKMSNYQNDYVLNKALFSKVDKVYNDRLGANLDKHQLKLTEDVYIYFKRNGASLSDDDKVKLRKIDADLSALSPKFSNNVLSAQNKFELWIANESDLEGLTDTSIDAAKVAAIKKGKEQEWLFTLQFPSYIPFLTYSAKRHLREKMLKAYGSLCNGGKYDNTQIVKDIVRLKHKRANLLGYDTFADYVLERRMAENSANVYKLLDNLYDHSFEAASKELDELKNFASELDGLEDFRQWDFAYYKEKLKMKKYQFESEALRPYFKSENVISGIFEVAKKLYGLSFKNLDNIDVWHKEVQTFEVTDDKNKHVGLLYIDLYPRETKRSGAWMNPILENGLYKGKVRRPQVVFVCSLTPSTKEKPSLLTYSEVETIFHEFGHCLHGLLADGKYQTTSGTNVFWDFVELPSQIMENWVAEGDALKLFAKHYKTGEIIPDELIDKIKDSSSYGAGYLCLRQLSLGYLDMAWYTNLDKVDDVEKFESEAIKKTQLFPSIPNSTISSTFGHIFSGGYSAGYYSYKWAEVLEADAFEKFKEDGIFNKETAESFRDNILSKGSLEHPMNLYKAFRGREPKVDALLKRDKLI
mgnify:CR=1 FL=1